MVYKSDYDSKVGIITICVKDNKLIGLFLKNQKYFLGSIKEELKEDDSNQTIKKVKKWLDDYFNNKNPDISSLSLAPAGTDFQITVWDILIDIRYGTVMTYKEVADKTAKKMNLKTMSAQAVGGAVGHNPISIIIPCHRVVGTNHNLTGYAGGIDKKRILLKHEGIDIAKYTD